MVNIRFILFLMLLFYATFSLAMEVAITVDDLPGAGHLPSNVTRMDVTQNMLEVFKKHHIRGTYGFIIGEKVNEMAEGPSILKRWMTHHQLLGNHTYSHLDLAKTTSVEYIQDIKKNELILKSSMKDKNYRYFRYPYLAEGNTKEKRERIRQFLFSQDYKIAEVTVDFFEYQWNDAYVRCLKKHDESSIKWIKKAYIEQALNALIIAHELSMMLFHRDVKNILLIHLNFFTAEMLDELITAYKKHGVQFISLSDALEDELYKINPEVVRERSYTFLNQIRLSRGLSNPEIVTQLYDSFPEEKLNHLCR